MKFIMDSKVLIIAKLFTFLVCSIETKLVKSQETTPSSVPNPPEGSGNGTKLPEPKFQDEYNGPAGWLRICQPGGKYGGVVTTSSDECPAGYWFKEPMRVGCACGHGVWVFAKGWCDSQARIIVAKDGACFAVNKDVKLIRQLGWHKDAFLPYSFVATTGMEYIQPVPQVSTLSNRATHFHPDYKQHIGSIFRETAVESMSGRFCYSQDNGNISRPLAMKYFVPKLPYFQKRHCFAYPNQDLSKFQYDLGFDINEGFSLQDEPSGTYTKKTWTLPAESAKCVKECRSPKSLNLSAAVNNSFGPDYVDPLIDEYVIQDLNEVGAKGDVNEMDSKSYALSNKTMQEMKEQTKRMIMLNIKTSIKAEPAPRIKYGDYRLVQKARRILEKVCPGTELPHTVLVGMHRMFRVALNESFFHYPFRQMESANVTVSILGTLDKCLQDAKPMTFDWHRPDGSEITDVTELCTATSATARKFAGVKYSFQTNDTVVNRTIIAKLPTYLWSNITDLDMPVETVWKTVMFTHYYCARHFKEDSVGFSEFEQKMERFFNRWVQHRWFYPGLALDGYKYVYNMYDLEKFAKSLDRCVAAARSFSVYRKWIKRPTYVQFDGKELFKEQYSIPDEVAGRTKLDAINPKLNQFDKKAYCLPYWHAPASNPGLNYNPAPDYKPGCIQYVKDEWKNPFTPLIGKPDGWRDSLDIL